MRLTWLKLSFMLLEKPSGVIYIVNIETRTQGDNQTWGLLKILCETDEGIYA